MKTPTGYLSRSRLTVASITAALLGLGALATIALQAADAVEGDDELPAAADEVDDAEDTPSWSSVDPSMETYEIVLTRDPFDTVRPPEPETTGSVEQTSAAGGSSSQGEGSTNDSTGGTTAPISNEGTGTASPEPACSTKGEVVCAGRVVTVLETVKGGDSAIVQVDSTVYDVGVGERFAESFSLLAVDQDGCARLLYGDEAFSQCPGRTALK